MSKAPYNPLDKLNLGKSVAEALLEQVSFPLSGLQPFNGAGIYAIYYCGNHPAYLRIAAANVDNLSVPIYVGKAIPSGARKGLEVLEDTEGRFLFNRLQQHAESIDLADNLNLQDFQARCLVVDDIWIPLGETLLIRKLQPAWNLALDGFGNHDPGKGRYNGVRPMWDTLHPGRPWAPKLRPRTETSTQLSERISQFLAKAGSTVDPHINFSKLEP